MAQDYHLFAHHGIQTLKPYVPGKTAHSLAMETGLTNIIKLSSNENPLGCSQEVLNCLKNMPVACISSYPSPYLHSLLDDLSVHHNISKDMIVLGNGTDMLIPLIINYFALNNNKHVLTHDYAFSSYQIFAQILGVPVYSAKVRSDLTVDIDELINQTNEQTAVIFLANPNNPTSLLLDNKDLKKLLNSIPATTILVIDEAYFEYSSNYQALSSLELLKNFDNLILLRTFSKAYGLAGLRLGYAITNANISHCLRKISAPFFVNNIALEAAKAALLDQNFILTSVNNNHEGLEYFKSTLVAMNLDFLPSRANFITVKFNQDALSIYKYLLNSGIIVRPLHPYFLNNYLRITIGSKSQNTKVLEVLQQSLRN